MSCDGISPMGWDTDPGPESDPEGTGFDSGHGRKLFCIVFFCDFLKNLGPVWETFRMVFGYLWTFFAFFSDMFGSGVGTIWGRFGRFFYRFF